MKINKNLNNSNNLKAIILFNIKRIRIENSISSKEMAYKIGIKPCDYSKLESGNKKNYEKYLSKIANILKIDKYELCINSDNRKYDNINNSEKMEILENLELKYIEIFRTLDKLDKIKDDMIKTLIDENKKLKENINSENKK